MANYQPIRPRGLDPEAIPSVSKKTLIMAWGGTILISSDLVFDPETAIPLQHGRAHEMPADAVWRCTQGSAFATGAELRRMDLA